MLDRLARTRDVPSGSPPLAGGSARRPTPPLLCATDLAPVWWARRFPWHLDMGELSGPRSGVKSFESLPLVTADSAGLRASPPRTGGLPVRWHTVADTPAVRAPMSEYTPSGRVLYSSIQFLTLHSPFSEQMLQVSDGLRQRHPPLEGFQFRPAILRPSPGEEGGQAVRGGRPAG